MSTRTDHQSQGHPFTIKASEIGEYGYCSRAWWYKHVVRLAPGSVESTESQDRFEAGIRAHAQHGRMVAGTQVLRIAGIVVGLCGVALIIIGLLLRA